MCEELPSTVADSSYPLPPQIKWHQFQRHQLIHLIGPKFATPMATSAPLVAPQCWQFVIYTWTLGLYILLCLFKLSNWNLQELPSILILIFNRLEFGNSIQSNWMQFICNRRIYSIESKKWKNLAPKRNWLVCISLLCVCVCVCKRISSDSEERKTLGISLSWIGLNCIQFDYTIISTSRRMEVVV